MIYLAQPTGNPVVHQAIRDGLIGFIDTPRQGHRHLRTGLWCADSGCYGKRFSELSWWKWLRAQTHAADRCLFATAPDRIGDAAGTRARAIPWLPRIRRLGFKAAMVAQNGQESQPVPWDEFDALFIGGTTSWKLSDGASRLVQQAKDRGKHVHMGRVNTYRRYHHAAELGCDSVDGTALVFDPTNRIKEVLRWETQYERGHPPIGRGGFSGTARKPLGTGS